MSVIMNWKEQSLISSIIWNWMSIKEFVTNYKFNWARGLEEGTSRDHLIWPPVPSQIQRCLCQFWHAFSNCFKVVLARRFCHLPGWPSPVLCSPPCYTAFVRVLLFCHFYREHLFPPSSKQPFTSLKSIIMSPRFFSSDHSYWILIVACAWSTIYAVGRGSSAQRWLSSSLQTLMRGLPFQNSSFFYATVTCWRCFLAIVPCPTQLVTPVSMQLMVCLGMFSSCVCLKWPSSLIHTSKWQFMSSFTTTRDSRLSVCRKLRVRWWATWVLRCLCLIGLLV